MNIFFFILKVFIPSVILSIAIKQLGPALSVPETTTVALIAVLLPPIVLAIILGLRIVVWK